MVEPSGYRPWTCGSAQAAAALPGCEMRSCPAWVGALVSTVTGVAVFVASSVAAPDAGVAQSAVEALVAVSTCPDVGVVLMATPNREFALMFPDRLAAPATTMTAAVFVP